MNLRTTLIAVSIAIALLTAAWAADDTVATANTEPPTTTQTDEDSSLADTQTSETELVRLWVAADTIECDAVGPQTCLQISRSSNGAIEMFYSPIERFRHVTGTRYVIDVEVTEIVDPPADGSSLSYRLIEIIETQTVTDTTPSSELTATSWKLAAFNVGAATIQALDGTEVTLVFADGRFNGSGGCNAFSAEYTTAGDSLVVGEIASSLMACEPAIEDQEARLFAALKQAASFTIDNGVLTIGYDDSNTLILTETTSEVEGLAGTRWSFAAFSNGNDWQSVLDDTKVTLDFEGNRIAGSAGCNTLMGSYTIDGTGGLEFGELATTRRLCPPETMTQETQLLEALGNVESFFIGATGSLLLNHGENAALIFEPS